MSHVLKERFDKRWMPEPYSGCWLWIAGRTTAGYGTLRIGKTKYAHRLSWEIHHGSIPKGISVLHKCDTPACVNPDHLFLGTGKDNMADCVKKGRHRPSFCRGEASGVSKLRSEDVIEIRKLYRKGRPPYKSEFSLGALAKRFGVCVSTIHWIVTRGTWEHL